VPSAKPSPAPRRRHLLDQKSNHAPRCLPPRMTRPASGGTLRRGGPVWGGRGRRRSDWRTRVLGRAVFGGAARLVTGCNGRGRSLPRAHFGPGGTRAAMSPEAFRTFFEPILSEARPACRTRRRAGRHLVRRRAAPRGGRGPGADRQGRRDTDHPLPVPGRRRVLRPGGQPPAQRGRGRPAVGRRPGAWPASRASPSSNAACASGCSYAASAWNPARSASRRTGPPAAIAARETRSGMKRARLLQ
jgi:hypothetical protein